MAYVVSYHWNVINGASVISHLYGNKRYLYDKSVHDTSVISRSLMM
jgi:hypothetical protein